ncbi:MAG: signal peptidase II [Legionellales bacterium]|nr:signal peptidase II [Legionellales bacterium]
MDNDIKEWHTQNTKWLLVSALVIFLDQSVKWIVRKTLFSFAPLKILPWLNFKLAFNTGMAYGFLSDNGNAGKWLLIGIAVLISGYLWIWIFQSEPYKKLLLFALSLILGGALSNMFDRIWMGYVTDFIDFHINTWHFATFNLADSAISIGAVILIFLLVFKREI